MLLLNRIAHVTSHEKQKPIIFKIPRFPWASILVKRSTPRRIETFQQMLLQTWLLYLPHSVTSLRIYNISVFITTDAICKANVTITRIVAPVPKWAPERIKRKLKESKQVNSYGMSQTHSFRVRSPLHYQQNIKTGWEQALGVREGWPNRCWFVLHAQKWQAPCQLLVCC